MIKICLFSKKVINLHPYVCPGYTCAVLSRRNTDTQKFSPYEEVKVKLLSPVRLFASPCTVAHQAPLSMGFPGKNTGEGCHSLLQGIFPTQGWNPGVPHDRKTLHHLSHQGSSLWRTGHQQRVKPRAYLLDAAQLTPGIGSLSGGFLSSFDMSWCRHLPCTSHSSRSGGHRHSGEQPETNLHPRTVHRQVGRSGW